MSQPDRILCSSRIIRSACIESFVGYNLDGKDVCSYVKSYVVYVAVS
jgi:hypothetical protein